MNDDIKSMIKSRRDQRYHGSAYGDGQVNKAVTDHKKELLPILNKLRNKEPLTFEEMVLVDEIANAEKWKTIENVDMYQEQAFKDGVDSARRYLGAGGSEEDLDWDTREKAKALSAKYDEKRSAHTKELDQHFYYPEDELRGAIRYAADNMGTEPRALVADWAKNKGMSVDSGAFGPPDDDEGPGYYDY